MNWNRINQTLVLTVLITGLIGCESEITNPEDQLIEGQVVIDATSQVSFTYFTFADGGSLVSVTDPRSSTDWDMAFRRYGVKLNGGVAGPGTVEGANLANNAGAGDTEVASYTPADAEAAFTAVTKANIATATFIADGLMADNSGSWFRYDPMAGGLVANPGAAWKVKESDGGFSVFRIAELNMMGEAPLGLTIEYRHQDAGGALGTINTVEVSHAQGPVFIDLASGVAVPPIGCGWDVSVLPFTIEFNDGCDAGTFPLDPSEDFNSLTKADDAPEYGGFLSLISGAFPTTVEDANGIFWYDIEGNRRMWPTHNVFLVRVGSSVYKVQINDYYNETGTSGFPTMRFEQLQ